jgi:hypothetical protein
MLPVEGCCVVEFHWDACFLAAESICRVGDPHTWTDPAKWWYMTSCICVSVDPGDMHLRAALLSCPTAFGTKHLSADVALLKGFEKGMRVDRELVCTH